MTTELNSFDASRLGAYTRSALGARNTAPGAQLIWAETSFNPGAYDSQSPATSLVWAQHKAAWNTKMANLRSPLTAALTVQGYQTLPVGSDPLAWLNSHLPSPIPAPIQTVLGSRLWGSDLQGNFYPSFAEYVGFITPLLEEDYVWIRLLTTLAGTAAPPLLSLRDWLKDRYPRADCAVAAVPRVSGQDQWLEGMTNSVLAT